MNTQTAIVPGSLSALAQQNNCSLAESFLNVDVLIMVDMSGSMAETDGPGGRSRYDAAEAELTRLQAELPGKIGVIAFSSSAVFCPGGRPIRFGGQTDMAAALNLARLADDTGVRFILISDGVPDSEKDALAIASWFKSRIDTIYIGPEGGRGAKFLARLSKAAGGQSLQRTAQSLLTSQTKQLLLA
jgi:Mg-chelatase subunit ChlD